MYPVPAAMLDNWVPLAIALAGLTATAVSKQFPAIAGDPVMVKPGGVPKCQPFVPNVVVDPAWKAM
jgi:hypothetical protein